MKEPNINDDIYLYILMRTDLPSQGPGRACAQASHATSCLEQEFKKHPDLAKWKGQTGYGYGTCIVLGATKEEIQNTLSSLVGSRSPMGWCTDPDYAIKISSELEAFIDDDKLIKKGAEIERIPGDEGHLILHRPEQTCAYILGRKADLAPHLGHFPLYQG